MWMLFANGKIFGHRKIKSGRKSSIKKNKKKKINREKKAQIREKEYHSAVKCAMQTKYANNLKNEPQDERLPRKFPQGTCLGTRLLHPPDLIIFIWKYIYLNNSGAFKDFKTFFSLEGRKNVFFGLWRWKVTLRAGNFLSRWWMTVLNVTQNKERCYFLFA